MKFNFKFQFATTHSFSTNFAMLSFNFVRSLRRSSACSFCSFLICSNNFILASSAFFVCSNCFENHNGISAFLFRVLFRGELGRLVAVVGVDDNAAAEVDG